MTLEVVPYDPGWPVRFEREADRLRGVLGSNLRVIEHVGSTSVPGLAAAPVVDIALSVEDLDALDPGALEELGYGVVSEHQAESSERRSFERPGFHVYAYEWEQEEFLDHVRFRDYLRTHREDAEAYGALKLRLAAQHAHDPESYEEAKAPFVARLVAALRRG